MKKINLNHLLLTLVLSSLLLTTCGPQATEEDISPTEEATVTIEEPTATAEEATVTQEPSGGPQVDVLLMSWADGDFEQWALETLIERFNATQQQYRANLRSVR